MEPRSWTQCWAGPRGMAAQLTVIADTDALDNTRGVITGPLHVRVRDLVFPEESWNDSPVIVLSWWAKECANLRARELATFAFMDGSLAFSVRPQTGTDAIVEFTRDADADWVVFATATVEAPRVMDAVLDAGRKVLAVCRQRSWSTPEIDELAASIEEASRPAAR